MRGTYRIFLGRGPMVFIKHHKKGWYPLMVRNSALGTRVLGRGCYLLNHGQSLWYAPCRAGNVDFSEHSEKIQQDLPLSSPKVGA